MSASGTHIQMSAEPGGSAAQNGVHHLEMEPSEPLVAASKEGFSGCADHIGHLDGWPRHLLRATAGVAIPHQRQRIERARGSV
jgi:hypothetical protein